MALVPIRHEKMTKRYQILINFLIVMFGISAWIGINGIFVQLPLLVSTAPEGWSLPAYLVIATQSANAGPVVYAFVRKFAPHLSKESIWISGLLILGTTAMGFLAFFYETTTYINGVKHSVVLFSLVFASALVGCSSSVIFLPYLKHFQDLQLVYFFIGEGFSGVLSGVLALIQGVGKDPPCPNPASNSTIDNQLPDSMPYFSTKVYFSLLFVILAFSTCAFWYLEFLRDTDQYQNVPIFSQLSQTSTCTRDHSTKIISPDEIFDSESPSRIEVSEIIDPPSDLQNTRSSAARSFLYLLLGLIALLSHGFLPGMQSYSCLPYGSSTYHLTIALTYFVNPIACTLALWLPLPGLRVITGVSTLAFVATSHVTWLAFSSPTPLWRDTVIGSVHVVVIWVILAGITAYTKLAISAMFKRESNAKSLFYVGIIIQVGSATGAILSFGINNYTSLLVPYSACTLPE